MKDWNCLKQAALVPVSLWKWAFFWLAEFLKATYEQHAEYVSSIVSLLCLFVVGDCEIKPKQWESVTETSLFETLTA